MYQIIESLVIKTTQQIIDQDELNISEKLDGKTPLFGKSGILDSVGLVTLVIEIEEAIEEQFDVMISLADEKAMSQKTSPFQTIGSLAKYADSLIQENL